MVSEREEEEGAAMAAFPSFAPLSGILPLLLSWFLLLPPQVAGDGNLTKNGYDVDGNMFKEAGLSRRFDPSDPSYVIHLVWVAMPGIAVAFAALLWFVVFFCGSKCCKCCRLPDEQDISPKQVLGQLRSPTVLLGIGTLLIACGTLVGWVASTHVQSLSITAVKQMSDGVSKYHEVVNDAKNSYRAFNPNPMLPLNVSVNGTYMMTKTADAALRGLERSMTQLNVYLSATKKNEPLYTSGYAWGFRSVVLLSSVVTVMVLFAAVLARGETVRKRTVHNCVGFCSWISFIVLILLWVVFAMHLDAAAIVTDSCPALSDEVVKLGSQKQANPEAAATDLRYLLSCIDAGDTTLVTALNEVKHEYHSGMEELLKRGGDVGDTTPENLNKKHDDMARLGLHTQRMKAVVEGLESASDCRNLQPYYLRSVSAICDTGYLYLCWLIAITGAMGFTMMAVTYAAFRVRRLTLEPGLAKEEYHEIGSSRQDYRGV